MHVLVRQQAGFHSARGVIDESALAHAAVVGLMVLQAEVRHVIAQAVQKVVIAVVVRTEKLVGLFDQTLVVLPYVGWRGKCGGAVGGNIHLDERVVGKLDHLEEFAGDDGRIDQRGEGRRLEDDLGLAVELIAGGGGDGQGRSKLPVGGKFQAGDVGEIVRLPAFGVEQNLIPADECHLVGRGGACGEAAFEGCRRKEVEFGVYFSFSGGNFDVDGEAVEQIATPFQGFAAGSELQAGQINYGAIGSMLAGNPLRVVERQVAGAGGDFQLGVKDLAGSRGGVYEDGYGWRRGCPSRKRREKNIDYS